MKTLLSTRKSWAGTPLRSVFSFKSDEEYMDTIGLLQQVQDKMREDKVDVVKACDQADLDGNGFLSRQELMNVFDAFGLPAVTPASLQNLMELMDVEGDNAIDYSEFSALLGADATTVSHMKAISKQSGRSSGNKACRKEEARLAHEARLEAEGRREEEWDAQFLQQREVERKMREEQRSDEYKIRNQHALQVAEETKRQWNLSSQNDAIAKLKEERRRQDAAARWAAMQGADAEAADFGVASAGQTFESKHPFEAEDEQEGTITFPSHVKNIQISFDEKSQGDEWAISCLQFTWDGGSKEFRDADAFCKFTIRSNEFQFSWRVLDPNESEAWGWKFTATPK